MIIPKDVADLSHYVEKGTNVFCFITDWCGDCHYLKPSFPEIEADFPEFNFIEVDRDQYIDIARLWDIIGIPSFMVVKDGEVVDRFVSKKRKTKAEVEDFLQQAAVKIQEGE